MAKFGASNVTVTVKMQTELPRSWFLLPDDWLWISVDDNLAVTVNFVEQRISVTQHSNP